MLIQFSKTLDSSRKFSCQEARATNITRDLFSCKFISGAVESSYLCYVRVTKLVRRLPEPLRLVENLNGEGASEEPSVIKRALGATQLDDALLSGAGKLDVLLYVEAAATHKRGRKCNVTLNDRTLYSYAVFSLREVRSMHRTSCEQHPLSFGALLLTDTPQTMISSLPVRKMYLNTMRLFFCGPADKKSLSCLRHDPSSALFLCS